MKLFPVGLLSILIKEEMPVMFIHKKKKKTRKEIKGEYIIKKVVFWS